MAVEWQGKLVLKADQFGTVECGHLSDPSHPNSMTRVVRRNLGAARWWLRPLARRLAQREARALLALEGCDFGSHGPVFPQLVRHDRRQLIRTFLEGEPMQRCRPQDPRFFAAAHRLLVQMHRRGVTHNDLAKEPNWLVLTEGQPALIDFQLASVHQRRSGWFRLKAREDLRHLLKHKRTYCPEALTPRERMILAHPAWPSRLWRRTGKPLYLWFTRRVLHWADREGAGDRGG